MNRIKHLMTIGDKDIFPDYKERDIIYELRKTVKVLVFDNENKIALMGRSHRYFLLPGGGVEENEGLIEACRREVKEEVGCEIKDIQEITVTEEFRAKIQRRQETHFFTAKISGEKGTPTSEQEDEQDTEVIWLDLPEIVELFEKQVKEIPYQSYHACFNVRTQLAALNFYNENFKNI